MATLNARIGDVNAGATGGVDRHLGGVAAALLDIGESQGIAGQRATVGRDMHGTPVGEHADQLLAGHARPMPHAAGVHVHERRTRSRIKADAATLQAQADDAKLFECNAGNVKVHGVAEHMLAEARDAAAPLPEHGVGFRRTVTAYDLDRRLRSGLPLHLPNEIDEVRVHAGLFRTPPIAQEPVQLLKRRFVVLAIALERDGDVFVGVDVVKRNGAGIAFGDGVLQAARAEEEDKTGNRTRIESARREDTTGSQARPTNEHRRPRIDTLTRVTRPGSPAAANNPNAVLLGRVNANLVLTPPRHEQELPAHCGKKWPRLAMLVHGIIGRAERVNSAGRAGRAKKFAIRSIS